MTTPKSARQELAQYAGEGSLRNLIEMNASGLSEAAINLLVDVVLRYCQTRQKRGKK